MSAVTSPLAVIGAGAWGTALAQTFARTGHEVRLWARETEVVASIARDRENPLYLPGQTLAETIRASTDLDASLTGADLVFLVIPAQFLRETLAKAIPFLKDGATLIICAKGIEKSSGALMSEVVGEVAPGRAFAVMSGPTFADEVACGLPTAVTLAADDPTLGHGLIERFGSRALRPYYWPDVIGAEIGGAIKNVFAIASGIVMGKALGENARAALLTRGLAQMRRLTLAKGGRAETVMGLSGLGDLSLTCNSSRSRNTSLGIEIGRGRQVADVLGERRAVTEGVDTSAAVVDLAARLGVEMPIATSVDAVVNRGADVDDEIEALLARPFREEFDRDSF